MNTSNVSPRQLRTRAFAIALCRVHRARSPFGYTYRLDERDRHSDTPIV